MELYLNGETVDLGGMDPVNIFLQALTDLQTNNQSVRQVILNGVALDQINLEQIVEKIQKGEVHSLDVQSVDGHALLMESVSTARDLLSQLIEELTSVAHAWQRGEDEKAFSAFSSPLEGLHSLLSLWEMLIGQELMPASRSIPIYNGLGEWLQSIQVAWERQDVIYMTDILLYEICPLLQQGEELLGTAVQGNL